jgi:Tol biopolymer transport system component
VRLDAKHSPVSLLDSPFNESAARFSPDKRWIAYVSDESGQPEVYVRAFPEPTGKWQVSTAGGHFPRWSREGRELVYLAPGGVMTAVPIEADDRALSPGAPRTLFQVDVLMDDHSSTIGALSYEPYAVSADGERFLLNERVDGPDESYDELRADPPSGSVAVIVNWTAALER